MLIWCEGGPSMGRAVTYPPPVELETEGGIYVLVDEGDPSAWHYDFIES